jgi:hypothetical protein
MPFGLSFTVAARVRGPLTEDGLRGALDRLRRRHPLLAVRIAPAADGAGACLTTDGVPPFPLRIAGRASDEDWVRAVEGEIARAFDYRAGPLCRCVWLRGPETSDLLVVFDHITTDGRASIYAVRDLLAFLADPGLEPEPLIPPMLRDRVPGALRKKILRAAAEFAGAPIAAHASQLAAPSPAPMRTLPVELDESATASLAAACRSRGRTVQAALCAAFAIPFAERAPDSPVRFVECPVDLRRRLTPPAGEEVGNYISLAVIRLDCAPGTDPWEIARRAGRELAAVTDEQLFMDPLVMMAVADHPITRPPVDVRYDLSISNVGRMDIPREYGPFRLEALYGPTLGVFLAGHRILAVTTFAGRMRCTFTSRDPDAPRLVARAREILAAMAGTPERTPA